MILIKIYISWKELKWMSRTTLPPPTKWQSYWRHGVVVLVCSPCDRAVCCRDSRKRLCANFCVLWRKKPQMASVLSFCGALAISDGGGILASYSIAEYRYISKFNYEFSESLCIYLGFVFVFTLMSSAMIVCCMSFDRFFAISFSIHYSSPSKDFELTSLYHWVLSIENFQKSLSVWTGFQ